MLIYLITTGVNALIVRSTQWDTLNSSNSLRPHLHVQVKAQRDLMCNLQSRISCNATHALQAAGLWDHSLDPIVPSCHCRWSLILGSQPWGHPTHPQSWETVAAVIMWIVARCSLQAPGFSCTPWAVQSHLHPTAAGTQLGPWIRRHATGTQHPQLLDSRTQQLWGIARTQSPQLLGMSVPSICRIHSFGRATYIPGARSPIS